MSDWITDSQDEQTIEELFRDADQIHIPIFQRSYVWKQKQFDELIADIELVLSEVEESQFLGAIVAFERPRPNQIVGRLRSLSVVDGQQRLLTLNIFLMAIVECMAAISKEDAAEVVAEFLLLPRRRGLDINTRIIPAFDDRNQYRLLWDRLNSPEVLQNEIKDNPPLPAPPSGNAEGDLVKQYHRILKYLKGHAKGVDDEKLHYYRNILNVISRHLTFVHLKLNDASAATKIFERLNFRGVKVGIVDLVRNEVFSSIAEDPSTAQHIFDHVWKPFEREFNGKAEAFFFPYCLIQNSNIKKSELFSQLRNSWSKLSAEEMVEHMRPFQKPFLAVEGIDNYPESKRISKQLEQLVRLRRPSSVYPYVMSLLNAWKSDEINEECCIDLLESLQSFLVRRSILGYEPTGLHALFKGLWGQMKQRTSHEFAEIVAQKPTIQWPSNGELREAIKKRPLAKAGIVRFLLREYDVSFRGDHPEKEPTIEHILPQSYEDGGEWAQKFSHEAHRQLKDTLANLLPLSSELNSSVKAREYSYKSGRYQQESMFLSPRRLSETWADWTVDTIKERAELMASWAETRWPHSLE
ncbi:DUF262 domain-containing protein [Thalassospira sp. MCCC 1A02491]|uniref:DUF262 domain-containing protein n=1 Tax=Thalassospira sp. MCCC 1A02491 TaxID=1769751 RepID=UPI0007AD6C50|nr:DUF262 domain-containing protein [Thalassospira sp. MCCC 1A02491]KZB62789.1 hypothetical protein AUQ42_03285 [Thalassospira sp. MCCC 1A02491]